MNKLPGVRTYKPLVRNSKSYRGKQYQPHTHNWQPTEKAKYGANFKLFVCLEHDQPVVQAYDMEVTNRDNFNGSAEFHGDPYAILGIEVGR